MTAERDLTGVRVAITGASGFCGAAIARAAARAGADVVCLGRRPGPVGGHIAWDAARERPDLDGADVVLHAAAMVGDLVGGRSVQSAFRAVNVDGAERLLDAADGRPVVWVSTASVYDPRSDRSLVREDHPIGGHLNAYSRTKAAGERLALAADAVVLRPRAVYGKGDPHLVPRLLSRVRAGVAVLPGPDVLLSLTAVQNLADACLAAVTWPSGAFNIADAEPYWRDTVVRNVLTAHGRPVRLAHVPVAVATSLARAAETLTRVASAASGRESSAPTASALWSGQPLLTRYSVDQVANSVVLDLTKAAGQGWRPVHSLDGYLTGISPA